MFGNTVYNSLLVLAYFEKSSHLPFSDYLLTLLLKPRNEVKQGVGKNK